MFEKFLLSLAAGVLLVSTSLAATYSESVQGDLSNDRFAPTPLALDAPSNLLSGSVTIGERDYFTITVPAGSALSQIILNGYESSNTRAFIGFQAGSTFTLDPSTSTADGLLGYMHFGIDQVIPSDLLDDLSLSLPPGFSIPLPAGNYSFWLNQTEPALTSYAFNFTTVAVPEPTSLSLMGAGLVAIGLLAGRSSRSSLRRMLLVNGRSQTIARETHSPRESN